MGIQYDFSAVKLLKRPGCQEASGGEKLENFMREKGIAIRESVSVRKEEISSYVSV
ncbi:MAG: hypothetical protein HFI16_03840 [Lachnospiraceae bacterium]|nr:hypothetical protein [Lachnospiraceae bacterium]